MKAYLLIFFLCATVFSPSFFILGQTKDLPPAFPSTMVDTPAQPPPLTPLEEAAANDGLEKEPEDFQAKFMHMIFMLGLLIGFMLLASWFIKRMVRTRSEQLNTTSNIKVLESRYLSPKATIHVLEILGDGYVVAESPGGITYLTKIPLGEESRPSTIQNDRS